MKSKKKIGIILIIVVAIIYFGLSTFYHNYGKNQLGDLKYSDKAIKEITKLDIIGPILKHNKYSKTVEKALENKLFMYSALEIYFYLDNISNTNDIKNINHLVQMDYSKEQILLIFKTLKSEEISDLIDHEKIIDIEKYLSLNYFNPYNLDRYLNYRDENPELNIDNIVTDVNIGLDFPYYVNIKEVKDSGNVTTLVNKYRKLPDTYIPENLMPIDSNCAGGDVVLSKVARDAFHKLCDDMNDKGFNIKGVSGYRSYSYQYDLYNRYAVTDGKEKADTYSARPGHSEHQLGLAIDVSDESISITKFKDTNEYKWLKDNAHKYGFIIRYPENKESITGYMFEPWHYRYVGVNIATYIYEHSITFDEYYIRYLDN